MTATAAVGAEFTVQTSTQGDLPPDIGDYAEQKVRKLARFAGEPILHARVRVSRTDDPAVTRGVTAQASLDFNGRLLRAQVAASDGHEAVDLLERRLRERLDRAGRHWQARRGGMPVDEPGQWRHVAVPTERPGYFPRPVEERQVVRRKAFAVPRIDLDEAAFDMDLADYDFYLFTDAATGQDSVLERTADGFVLHQAEPRERPQEPLAARVTVSELPIPRLQAADAVERLNASGAPFVFFVNVATGRGNVLYRRYDGHYGLLRPAV